MGTGALVSGIGYKIKNKNSTGIPNLKGQLTTSISELDFEPPKEFKFTERKVQHEFKHARDFGITDNWNKKSYERFKEAIIAHTKSVEKPILGKFRGVDTAYHFFDPQTGLDSVYDIDGNFLAAWKLSNEQIKNLYRCGNVQ